MYLILIAFAPFVYGCAATSKASEEKSTDARQFLKHADKGVVYLYRPGRVVGAAGQTQIKVDGTDAGGTGSRTFFRWELTPGSYAFSCFTSESSAVIQIEVMANEHYFMRQDERLGISSGTVTLKEENESTGMKGVEKCKLLVSTYKN